MNFIDFPKMARLSREIIVTEKMDGTNAQICIGENGEFMAGSRTRFITPDDDNFGFAAWAYENKNNLLNLGPGRHFGEWWGQGIQRGYSLTERRFSLFNVVRWVLHGQEPAVVPTQDPRVSRTQEVLPECCGLVPVLYKGIFSEVQIDIALQDLRIRGSHASRGFMNPEGVIIFHIAGNTGFKKTIEKDDAPKGKSL
jgi:hypothetical protein